MSTALAAVGIPCWMSLVFAPTGRLVQSQEAARVLTRRLARGGKINPPHRSSTAKWLVNQHRCHRHYW